MSLKKLSSPFLILATALILGSCNKKEGCTDPNATNYDPNAEIDKGCVYTDVIHTEFHFHAKVGAEGLIEGSTYPLEGVATKLNLVQFYISNIRLVDASGNETPAPGVYLLVKPEIEEYQAGDLPPGDYTKLRFDVGIDSVTNHSDPSLYGLDDPLGAQFPNMHWGWSIGYIFVRIDGEADVTGDGVTDNPDGLFEIHLGTDHFRAEVEIDYPISIADGNENIYHINVDWATFFAGTNLAVDNTTHTTDNEALAALVFDNLFNMFSPQ